jgi:hypothetical protein
VQLDRLTVALRPRNPWEAMDLGMAMARAHWTRIIVPWLVCFVPVVLLVSVILQSYSWVAPLVVWWLKPMFDRIPLFMLSRAAFGEVPRTREVVKSLLPVWRRHLLRDLTIGRFNPARSFDMPVRDLEGLRGKPRRERLKTLHRRTRSSAVWLTVACIHFEMAVSFSLAGLVYLFIPEGASSDGFLQAYVADDASFWMQVLQNAAYYVAMTLIEPFYVAAGFALYLNRRTVLEGWDIEIAFRHLAQRVQRQAGAAARSLASLVAGVLALVLAAHPGEVRAAAPEAAPAAVETVAAEEGSEGTAAGGRFSAAEQRARIAEVMTHKDLQTKRTETNWKYTGPKAERKESDSSDWSWLKKLVQRLSSVAGVVEVALWTLLALAIIWAISKRRVWAKRWVRHAARATPAGRETIFGLDIEPESLPADVEAEAWRLWQAGEPRAALSLLYRATLSHLVTQENLELGPQATEEDCLRLCRKRVAPEVGAFMTRLTLAWQRIAYAAQPIAHETARELCADWGRHFRGATS